MGKRKNTNKEKLDYGINRPIGKTESIRGSDLSDLESITFSSIAGDVDTQIEDEEDFGEDLLQEKISENVVNALDKRVNIRLKAMGLLSDAFKRHYMAEKVDKWKGSLCEIVEKNVKRSNEETVQACILASLLSIQLGMEIENDVAEFLVPMRQLCSDPSKPEAVRTACAQSIGICAYFSVDQPNVIYDCVTALKNVWTSFRAATVPVGLYSNVLSSWAMLLNQCDPSIISSAISGEQQKLCAFFDSSSVEVRIAAGEALAVLYEMAHNSNDEFRFYNHYELEDTLSSLAEDSLKQHAKRDKKIQKYTFRQINDTIFHGKTPQVQVRFNKRETLPIEDCHSKLVYDSLCQLLQGNINAHLSENFVIREVFELGPIVAEEKPVTKADKMERVYVQKCMDKARNIHRAKQRDKKVI